MRLKWSDSREIAIALDVAHPEVDPLRLNFLDLRDWVLALDDFADAPQHAGERVLEAIQMAWIDERG
jgi:FeS assembly protein IscX